MKGILRLLGLSKDRKTDTGTSNKEKTRLYFFNTLTGKKEPLKSLKSDQVGMYNCGPTVYNYVHIGNLRSYVFADILRRTIELSGLRVNQVINITDVGHLVGDGDQGKDKVEEEARKASRSAKEITNFYTQAFFDDLKKLNIQTKDTNFPRATEHITEQISLIETLEKKGFTYQTSDGIYFNTKKFKEYGKLGNLDLSGIEEGARIGVNPEKKNPTDFALWKFSPKDEKREQEWQSPWGVGFPGWHIECSAMAMKYLGETFDIHTGGIDHIPVHHNNEIAQSESATGKQLARFWLHNEFVTVPSGKMAKSAGNFVTLTEIEKRGIHPLAYRYWLLTAHYRSQITFTYEALEGASRAYTRLVRLVSELPKNGKVNQKYKKEFLNSISNDLETPQVIALIWDLMKDESVSDVDKRATVELFDTVLGLKLSDDVKGRIEIPKEIHNLVEERETARKEKRFEDADRIRDKIRQAGFDVYDTEKGPEIEPISKR